MVPVANVMAIYARETGQGMAFPPEEDEVPEDGDAPSMEEVEAWSRMRSPRPSVWCNWFPSRRKQKLPAKMMLLVRRRPQAAVRRSSV
jgi:stringent starvation protein B